MNPDFGTKHLTGLGWLLTLIAIVLTVLLVIKKKKNLDEKFDRAVIRYTCYFMWAWEIVKTIVLINSNQVGGYGPIGYYPLWMAPFHICSMGLYAYLIIGSKHPGKLAEWVTPFAYALLIVVTSIILIIPGSAGLLGTPEDWSICYDNILPYQTWLYHGSLLFVSLYMALSGFYKPKFMDIPKATIVLCTVAVIAQALNAILVDSNADFMTLKYGNGNPFAFLLYSDTPILYYIVLMAICIGGMSAVISATIGIRALVNKAKESKKAA